MSLSYLTFFSYTKFETHTKKKKEQKITNKTQDSLLGLILRKRYYLIQLIINVSPCQILLKWQLLLHTILRLKLKATLTSALIFTLLIVQALPRKQIHPKVKLTHLSNFRLNTIRREHHINHVPFDSNSPLYHLKVSMAIRASCIANTIIWN